MKKLFSFFLWIGIGVVFPGSGHAQDMLQVLTPGVPGTVTHQLAGDDRLIVSVMDSAGNPVRGLGLSDCVVQKDGREAKLISVEPLETSQDVGLNVILVLDNSTSMENRKAIEPLLSALEEFLKIVRPIDNIHAVVFDPARSIERDGRVLHAKDIQSQNVSELRRFFEQSFAEGLSIKTFLYEGILAAFDIARKMPAGENKLVVIFSDGEDINSSYGAAVVQAEAKKVENVQVYAIDYMPGKALDPFLTSLAESHGGRIWKAVSASELVPIFQAFSTALLHQYVVTYRFLKPPEGSIDMVPGRLDLEMLTLGDGSPVPGFVFFEVGRSAIPSWYTLLSDHTAAQAFDEKRLADAMGRYRNVLNIVGQRLRENPEAAVRIVGYSGLGTEKDNMDLAKGRAEAVRTYLTTIWGIEESRMTIEAQSALEPGAGQESPEAGAESRRAALEFADPGMQEQLVSDFIAESGGADSVTVRPLIVAEHGVADWELTILGDDRALVSKKGEDDLKLVYSIALDELDKGDLTALNGLKARIDVTDKHGDTFTTETAASPITVTKRKVLDQLIPPVQATLAMTPEAVTIEEVTMIDSSPTLNYIFFDEGNSEIPHRYTLFVNQRDAESFDETGLKGAMEKYAHILNVVGKRLVKTPEAKITLVGCNSNYGPEKGRTDLSRSRAEAVRGYLKYIWGIDFSRMEVKAQNLPQVPTTNRSPEGRAENQRVEIRAEAREILDTTQSTYIEEMSDAEAITIEPNVQAGFGVKQWKLDVKGDGAVIQSITGTGNPEPVYSFRLKDLGLKNLSGFANLNAEMEVVDERDQVLRVATKSSTAVKFIKREQRLAEKRGYRVLERYALILFDYDSDKIKGRNEVILGRIMARMKELPDASVKIVGHTDTIGEEEYNMRLSEKRAKAVYKAMTGAGLDVASDVTFGGVGPRDPLYDNVLPEGRSFNRTVTVSLEYDKRE